MPGDVFEESEQPTSELRCKLSEEVLAMLDHARRLHSVEQGEAVTTAQVLEFALVSYISNLPLDQDSLEKVRQEMNKDLQAERAREIPLVAAAREVAVEMGLLVDHDADETTPPGQNHPTEDCAEALAQALGTEPSPEVVQETEEALASFSFCLEKGQFLLIGSTMPFELPNSEAKGALRLVSAGFGTPTLHPRIFRPVPHSGVARESARRRGNPDGY